MGNIEVLIVSCNYYLIRGLSLYFEETFPALDFHFFVIKPVNFNFYFNKVGLQRFNILCLDLHSLWSHVLTSEVNVMFINGKTSTNELNEVVTNLLSQQQKHNKMAFHKTRFSKRELEIWTHLYDGACDAVISKKMDISIKTVRTHRRNIIIKLGLKNKNHLIKLFFDSKYKI
ncbi:hypothetical protein EAG21025_42940 (plasmid) [Enterobacter asburiae]|uniref:helix-turn-helix transcriptional regulator n=1 Tax=Enterobacter asburiae TaxID=61645 RepID=UPI0034E8FE0E|nr:helix-turn-helix transcriptional regulator [Enterobacter asburiae]